jgi:dienelactone hydrolase
MEEPIRLRSGSDDLFGMLHTPDVGPARAGILVVNSRVEYRVGPHRFYVHAARRWTEQGFAVLRLDYAGNGDSPGHLDYAHMDSFPVQPAVDAVEVLRERAGVSDVVLAGLCMGARNALYAAAQSAGVRHLVAFGMPFSDATPDIGVGEDRESTTVGTAVARRAVSGYLKRALDPGSWKRLLSGQSDYGVIKRVLPAALGIGRSKIFEEPVFRSLDAVLARGGQIQLVFGSNDVFLPDFKDQFELVRSRLPNAAAGCTIELIPDANHTFSRSTWQQDAIGRSLGWLEERFPAAAVASA